MSQNGIIGLILVGLLVGGMVLLSRRSISTRPVSTIPVTPVTGPRYRNKEIRDIEWNDDGLPVKITITRDYTVT